MAELYLSLDSLLFLLHLRIGRVLVLPILPIMKGQDTMPMKSAQIRVGEKGEDGSDQNTAIAKSNVVSNSTTRVRVSILLPS